MTNSRDMGAGFERKICNMIKDALGYKDVKRNIEQVRSGGADIIIPNWSIECKAYQKSGSNSYRPSWWEQAKESARELNLNPVLIYKYNNCPIKCVVHLDTISKNFSVGHDLVCEVDFDTWCYIVREKIDAD